METRRFIQVPLSSLRPGLTIFLCGVLLLAGCQKSSSTPQAAGLKTIRVARASEPEWLNPVAGHQHADSDMAIFRGLFKVNEKNELIPDMAASTETSPDGKVYTIRLRPGITWQDGKPFTADDVKFTIDTVKDPKNHSGLRKQLDRIEQVDVVDPLTVRISLSQPLAPLPSKLKIGMIPKHALEGKDFNTDEFNHLAPVGTGPYRFSEWKRGEYLVLTPNPTFYGEKPKLDRVIYKFLPDPNVRLVQLKNNEIDLAEITPKQVSAVKASPELELKVVDTADYRVMMFNLRFPIFQDVRVRQAVQFATDRQALVDGALLGYGAPAYGPLQFYPKVPSAEMPRHDNDVTRAAALLKEAGWAPGKDGIMEKGGRRLSFHLTVPANDPIRADLATLLVGQLKRAGIEAIIEVKDFASFKIPEVEALILGGGLPDEPDDDLYNFFASHVGEEGSNYSGYKNPKVDKLLEEGRSTLDLEARKKIYQEIQKELVDDPPYNYLVYLKHLYVVRKGFTGFTERIFGHGTSPLWNIEAWSAEGKGKG